MLKVSKILKASKLCSRCYGPNDTGREDCSECEGERVEEPTGWEREWRESGNPSGPSKKKTSKLLVAMDLEQAWKDLVWNLLGDYDVDYLMEGEGIENEGGDDFMVQHGLDSSWQPKLDAWSHEVYLNYQAEGGHFYHEVSAEDIPHMQGGYRSEGPQY